MFQNIIKQLLLLFIIIFSTIATDAQTASIKGVVTDTLNKQNLSKAVVSLLKSKDTVLYTFTRTNNNGDFMLTNIQQGKYIVLVTYPGYADYYDTISIASKEIFTIGTIKLTTKAHLLEDVIVVQKIAAVRMKGDTLVYKADSFKVKPGAWAEMQINMFGKLCFNLFSIILVLIPTK
ncbi:MAG: carboxypeptidase regulatory-like domain-containing protein [Chitinophagaceae bacterium]|nr:carboxypeptidase regulatory-like domain-containing protein [Chitinophagaceae bacterium]MCW5905155.1 carboxypeptidase regulatory-like domain-containing protein [Chitinophagaceae bacterium]